MDKMVLNATETHVAPTLPLTDGGAVHFVAAREDGNKAVIDDPLHSS